MTMITKGAGCAGGGSSTKSPAPTSGGDAVDRNQNQNHNHQVSSVLELLLSALRKSMVSCRVDRRSAEEVISAMHHQMEIGWPTNVQHIAHVTFDRFNGFLGLPVEFEVEIPCKVPSASASVFGVSAESMQCSYDSKGNSVPTILLLMQERLYSQRGLKAEGIFRINPENTQEKHVRDQLNRGIVPDNIDVHCLAGLIKTWFRELPSGVLDGLSPEQVLNCNSEEDYTVLVKQLKPTEAGLLSWAIDLMADVVEEEEFNKMNARNIAMVFSPNMTQMSDPLTALMHAVQVMNLLKTLITRTLRQRYDDEDDTDVSEGGGSTSTMGDQHSPVSSRSSSSLSSSGGDYDEDHEEMDVSCEEDDDSTSDDSDQLHNNYYDAAGSGGGGGSNNSGGGDDGEHHKQEEEGKSQSQSQTEEVFLRQLDDHNNNNKTPLHPDVATNKGVQVVHHHQDDDDDDEKEEEEEVVPAAVKDMEVVVVVVVVEEEVDGKHSCNKDQLPAPPSNEEEEVEMYQVVVVQRDDDDTSSPSTSCCITSETSEDGFRDVEMIENSTSSSSLSPTPPAASKCPLPV